MKKKVLLIGCIIVVILVLIITAIVVATNQKKSPEALAKDFEKAIKSEEKLEKYLNKNIDFKFGCALAKLEENFYELNQDELNDRIKEEIKGLDKDEVEEYKDYIINNIKDNVDEGANLKFKELSSEKDAEEIDGSDRGMKYRVATYTTSDGEEVEYTFMFFQNKLIAIVKDDMSKIDEKISELEAELEQSDKKLFNDKFEAFVTDSARGEFVEALLEFVISSNEGCLDNNDHFLSVEVGKNTDYNNSTELDEACKTAKKDENEENIKNANNEIKKLKQKIDHDKKYEIKSTYEDGVIVKMTINEKDE